MAIRPVKELPVRTGGCVAGESFVAADMREFVRKGMVPLPVDADGEPINVGDVMEGWGSFEYHDLMEQPVESMVLHDRGRWEVCCDYVSTWEPSRLRHHHAPTVEDVLRKFAEGLGVPVADSYVAAAAAKLRMAGEDA